MWNNFTHFTHFIKQLVIQWEQAGILWMLIALSLAIVGLGGWMGYVWIATIRRPYRVHWQDCTHKLTLQQRWSLLDRVCQPEILDLRSPLVPTIYDISEILYWLEGMTGRDWTDGIAEVIKQDLTTYARIVPFLQFLRDYEQATKHKRASLRGVLQLYKRQKQLKTECVWIHEPPVTTNEKDEDDGSGKTAHQ